MMMNTYPVVGGYGYPYQAPIVYNNGYSATAPFGSGVLPWRPVGYSVPVYSGYVPPPLPMIFNAYQPRPIYQPSTNSRTIIDEQIRTLSYSRDYYGCVNRSSKPILKIDMLEIGPDDDAHHPYDKFPYKIQLYDRKPRNITTNTNTDQYYVTDLKFHEVMIFGPDGAYQGKVGGFGSNSGKFDEPSGIAYDATLGRIYVVDRINNRVQVFEATTWDFLFEFGSKGRAAGQFLYPYEIDVSTDGFVVVTDSMNSRIQLFTPSGRYLRQFNNFKASGPQNKFISKVRGIAFDNEGKMIYWTDFHERHVCRIDINFKNFQIFVRQSAGLCHPIGIDLDAQGKVIICDVNQNVLHVFNPNGQPACPPINKIGRIFMTKPLDVTVMRGGFVAVVECNGLIKVF